MGRITTWSLSGRVLALVSLALAALDSVQAQSLQSALEGLQPACKTNVVVSAAGISGCTDLTGLLKIANLPSSQSVVPPLRDYISAIKDTKCQQSDLDAVKNAIAKNCQEDKDKPPVVMLNSTVSNWPAIRELLLLKQQGSSSNFCVTTIMAQAQSASHQTFSKDKLTGLFNGNPKPFLQMLDKLPTDVYCNDCGKALVSKTSVLVASTNPSAVSGLQNAADGKCGKDFSPKDGSVPKAIDSADKSSAWHHAAVPAFTLLLMACLGALNAA